MPTTAILGGGLTGLSAAYYLTKINPAAAVTIFERNRRVGGWVQTEQHSRQGFRFEKGPRTIRPAGEKGRNTLRLIDELQLADSIVPIRRSHVAAQNRMIFAHDQLCMLPSSSMSLFRKLPPFSQPLIMAALNDLRTGRSPEKLKDESIYDFAARRFGDETAKYLVSSMICGICAGDAKQISVKFLMPDVFRMEQQYGGVLKGVFCEWWNRKKGKATTDEKPCNLEKRAISERWSIYSFRDGMEMLPKALQDRVTERGVKIQNNMECKKITTESNRVTLHLANGTENHYDRVISTLPSVCLAPLLNAQHPELAAELDAIPYVDVALINLQYDSGTLLKDHPGFGFLVPPSEDRPILGVIFDSCCFPAEGKTVLTVMMGGAWFKERFGATPTNKELYKIANEQLSEILNIKERPSTGRVHILHKCIPQYIVGHVDRVARIRNYVAEHQLPLALCGAAFDGVGVNDVIFSAKQAVDSLQRV